ncbi:uncharacterized protein LOC143289333 [Babylonia areolata]|uniref:uncharacterized protein LOC143289333 n=1 Tax=Babylonia areolata TaxID=304850 RepID=UPI003FD33972
MFCLDDNDDDDDDAMLIFRFMLMLNGSGPIQSPFSSPLLDRDASHDVTNASPLPALRHHHNDVSADFVTPAYRSMFVRNPYSRMFSAFVDKAFAPNPTFWQLWGVPAITRYRRNADPESLRCGHDVTFAEVLAYAVARLHRGDLHFQPMWQLCKPCAYSYHFIGKMETFSKDLNLLAHTLNLSVVPYFRSTEFRTDYVRDAIEDSIKSPFSWLREIQPCMSKYEAGLRIWRKLQIRGLISRRLRFPYTGMDFTHVTAEELIDVALKAHSESRDKEELKQQKHEALVEAFRSVDRETLMEVERIWQDDFAMFGYLSHPEEIFSDDGSSVVRTGAFDWRSDW